MAGQMILTAGSIFAGDFRIERQLAEGGMGVVYVAEQISTGQKRALKVMLPNLVPDEKSRERFLEEARVGSRVQSEHVVQVVASGVDSESGVPWLAMELLDGEDLEKLIQSRGALSMAEVLEILEQVCHALGDAHSRGIIHRDLKPENLFVARSHRRGAEITVKILDFGIARTLVEQKTAATVTSAIGSPLWMAPEQAQSGAKLRPATDVWALGLIAFYLLTGRYYWRAANHAQFNMQALLVEILTLPLDPPSARAKELGSNAEISPGFDTFFSRCVARDPDQRFADGNAAIGGLREAFGIAAVVPAGTSPLHTLAKKTAVMPPSPTRVPSPPPVRGSLWGWPLALGAVLLLLVATSASAAIWYVSQDHEQPDGPIAGGDVPQPPQVEPAPADAAIPPGVEPPAHEDGYARELAACRAAVTAGHATDAITHARAALEARPRDHDAIVCRQRASALRTSQRPPPVDPIDQQLAHAEQILPDNPQEALQESEQVLHTRGISPAQRARAQSISAGARRALEPPPQPQPQPTPQPDPQPPTQDRTEAARQCLAQNDCQCVVRLLAGQPITPEEVRLLIDAQRCLGTAPIVGPGPGTGPGGQTRPPPQWGGRRPPFIRQ